MERKIYKGRFQPYLEDVLIREIRQLKRKPLDTVDIVVATNLLRRHLRSRLAEEQGAIAGLKFWGFNDMEKLGCKNLGVQNKELSQEEMALLILRALNEASSDDLFQQLKEKVGFAQALIETIADLKDASITPEELAEIARQRKLSQKVLRIAKLYRRYEEFKREIGLLDSKDLLSLAIGELKRNPPKHDHPVFIHGLYDITNQQKELLASFLGDSDAIATVPWWKSVEEYVKPYIEFLEELGFREVEFDEVAQEVKDYCLWNDNVEAEVFSSPNKVMEARSIIKKIFDYCAKEEIPLDETAIIFRQPEDYLEIFKDEIKSAGIPYYSIGGDDLLKTPAGRGLYLLMEFVDSNYSRKAFLTLLDGAIFKADCLPLTSYDWTKITNKAYIVEGKENWFKKLDKLIEKSKKGTGYFYEDYDEQKDDITEDNLLDGKKFLEGFFADVEAVLKCEKWLDFHTALEKLWTSYFEEKQLGYAEVKELIDSFEGMDKVGMQFDFELAKDLVHEMLQSGEVKDSYSVSHGVVLAGLMSARCVPFKVVAVPGLVEGSFPRKVRQDALLLDEERVRINEMRKAQEKPQLDLKLRGIEEEKLLFGLAMQAGIKKVLVSYPRLAENRKRENMPSVFFLKAGERKKGQLITAEKLSEFKESKLSKLFDIKPTQALQEFEFKMALLNQTSDTLAEEDFALDNLSVFPYLKRGLTLQRARYNSSELTTYDGVLTPDKGLSVLKEKFDFNKKIYSASELERYTKCPFVYFLERVLRVKEYEEPEKIWEIEALERGKLVHKILARFYRDLRQRGLLPIEEDVKEERKNELKKIAEEEFRLAEENEITGFKPLWEIEKESILELLNTVIEDDVSKKASEKGESPKEWVPQYFEAEFGYGRGGGKDVISKEPVTSKISDTKIRLRGRIDRVDFDKTTDAMRAMDYKTGSKSDYTKKDTKKGKHIQALLYAYCASEILDKSLDLALGDYFFLKENKHCTHKFCCLHKELGNVLEAISYGISNGLFFIYHESCKSDEHNYCPFKFLCKGADEVYENKKDDLRLEKWRIIKEPKDNSKKDKDDERCKRSNGQGSKRKSRK